MAANFNEPNWGQKTLIRAAGMDPEPMVVRVDNDAFIVVMNLTTRMEYSINKKTGSVIKH